MSRSCAPSASSTAAGKPTASMSAAAASFRIELLYPSPHALLRVVGRVGSEAAGVGGCSVIRALDNAPTPDPSPPLASLVGGGENYPAFLDGACAEPRAGVSRSAAS